MIMRQTMLALAASLAAFALGAPALAQDGAPAFDAQEEYRLVMACSILEDDAATREQACSTLIASEDANIRRAGYGQRANLRYSERRFEDAIQDYTAVIGLDPRAGEAYQYRGAAQSELKRFAEAKADGMTAVKIAPMNASFHNSLCWTLALEGVELERAVSYCSIAIGMAPAYTPARDSRAMAYLKQGKFDLALADYVRAYETERDRAHYAYGRGIALMRLGRNEEGKRWLDDALKTDPEIAEAYARYGVAL